MTPDEIHSFVHKMNIGDTSMISRSMLIEMLDKFAKEQEGIVKELISKAFEDGQDEDLIWVATEGRLLTGEEYYNQL